MTDNNDPLGYYKTLGLATTATPTQIEHAYKEWAKRSHPDMTKSEDYTLFLLVRKAYEVLGDPVARSHYDRMGANSDRNNNTSNVNKKYQHESYKNDDSNNSKYYDTNAQKLYAIKCDFCKNISAQPRFCEFARVYGFLVYTAVQKISGVFCPKCAQRFALKSAALTYLLGLWSPHGFLLSIIWILRATQLGRKPQTENFRVLWSQAEYFIQSRRIDLAVNCLLQAKHFASSHSIHEIDNTLFKWQSDKYPILSDRWSIFRTPLRIFGVFPIFIILGAAVISNNHWDQTNFTRLENARNGNDTSQRPQINTVAPPRNYYISQVDVPFYLLDDQGKAFVYKKLAIFTDVTWTSGPDASGFVTVQTTAGITGLVHQSSLSPGNGKSALRNWCLDGNQQPRNGQIFVQTATGPNHITIKNGSTDSVVKFKTLNNQTVFSVFVAAYQTFHNENFPDGVFQLSYSTGNVWSARCGKFMNDMASYKFPSQDVFRSWTEPTDEGFYQNIRTHYIAADYTITPVVGGNVHAESVSDSDFSLD